MKIIFTNRHLWRNKMLLSVLFPVLICLVVPKMMQAQRFVHPGIPFTKYDLEQLKANTTKEPWLSAYNAFKNDARSKLSYAMQGPTATVTRAPNLNNTRWISDMIAIHNLAFMWVFTGDSAYARKATDMLDAWAVTNTVWGGNESMLDIGDHVQYWATGADILRSTFPGWTAENTAHVKNYFANVLYPTSWVPFPLRDQNKGALQLKIALAAAAFLDDTTKFREAIEVYRMDAGGGMRNSLPNGEVGDAGRDDHWRVQAAALAWGAEVAYKQGIDMYAELDNRVLAIGELYHKYAFEGDTMTFIPFGGYATYWTNWGIAPGARTGDMTNLIKAAYSLRKGIPTPYTDRMRQALGGAGGNFLYLKSADTSTATPLPPVYYPADHVQPVSHLTNMDIGNPGIAGSASYDNGVWTVKAAGNSTSNAFNFTFKKMTGDAGLVVKVNSMSLNSSGCGVMIRQSLAPGAPFWDLYLAATGGAGRHWQPKAPWWLKIERVGIRIFTYHSHDGIHWTNLGCSYSTTRPEELYFGFYTISNNTSALNTATFSNVAFSQGAPAGSPEISSATSATVKVGTAFNYTITASANPSGFSATGLPGGLSLNSTTGLISGTPDSLGTYVVTLGATNASGTGTATLVLKVISNAAPGAPAGVSASVVNATQIRLSWTASPNATSYTVKRSLTVDGLYIVIQSGITGTSFTDPTPVPEVNNYYLVTAFAGELESGNSNIVYASVPPAIPSKPVVVNKSGQIDLSWESANGATTYKVKRANVSGGPYTVIAQLSATKFSDLNVTNGSGYYYVVSSVGNTLESANSVEAFGVPGSNSSTWSAAPATTNWNNASNWVEGAVPANPAIVTFRGTTDSVLTNDLNDFQVSRMLFDTTASGFTINGNSFELKTDLVNTSPNMQTINNPITINNQVNVNTVSTIKLAGVVSGSGSLVKNGSGFLHISGNNTYSGNTILNGPIAIAGNGAGTSGSPVYGPLGTGKIIMNGGSLHSGDSTATIYNDIEVTAGKRSDLGQSVNAINIYGRLTGSGTLWEDGNDYPGINLYGDNSGFTGTFVAALRSGRNRVRFQVPQAGSAKAHWLLDANGIDCIGIHFGSGTLHFGGLSGRGYIRNDAGGSPVISIGALNTNTDFGGTLDKFFLIEKVGTGTLTFWGNHTYGGTTTIKNGTFLLNNSATSGAFASPVVDSSGTFGGTGLSQASATIGTGTAAKAYLAPGNGGIGTLTVASLTMNSNATYNVEVSSKNGTADKMKVSSASLVGNPVLSVTDIDSGALAPGTNFTIIQNTGVEAIAGTFKDLPEMSVVKAGNYDFRITYKGGDGNDLVLMDDRATPVIITSAKTDTALIGRPYQYTIAAIKSPRHFNAFGLPAGLSVDTTNGIISGTTTVYGNFNVVLTAANDTLSGTDTLRLVVLNYVTSNITAAEGDARVIVEWNSILKFSYKVKRSTSPSGPFTVIGTTTTARYTDSLLANGTTYYYVVAAIDGSTEYPESSPVAATPKSGQWGYWKFNESAGTKAIDVWGANHGTLQATAARDTGYVAQALKLDGSANAYAQLPQGIFSTLNDFTAMAWIKPRSLSTWMRVFDFGSGTDKYFFLTPQAGIVEGKQIIRYAIKNGGSEQAVTYNYTVPLNDWTHLAITQSGNTCTLYINGAAVASNTGVTTKPATIGSTTQNYVGKSQWPDPMYNGSIDELKIYNRALTRSEIVVAGRISSDTAMKGKPYQYIPAASIPAPKRFRASGLPDGLSIDSTTGLISGTPGVSGQFKVNIIASDNTTSGRTTLYLEVLNNVLNDMIVAGGDGRTVVEWNALPGVSFNVKRSISPNGPFDVLVNTASTKYIDSTVSNGVTYYYQVTARDTAAEYASSNIVEATPNAGQLGYWKFNEDSGLKAIDAWGANHGTLQATASRDSGYVNRALKLDGSASSYAQLPNGIFSTLNDFTAMAWIKPGTLSTWMRIFDFGSGTGKYFFLTSQAGIVDGKQIIRYAIKNGGSEQAVSFNYAIPLNAWTHLAVTQSGNTCALYINGVPVASNSAVTIKPAAIGSTTQNYVGKSQWNDPLFKGLIDELKVYQRALSASEIANAMKGEQTITFAPLPEKTTRDADFSPGAFASSGLPVSYSSSDTTVATITADGKIHIAGTGTTNITAAQAGNEKYRPATDRIQPLRVLLLPIVKAKDIQVVLNENGVASITPAQVDNGSESYNGALTRTLDRSAFGCNDTGTPVAVVLMGTDAKGFTSSDTAMVTVVDTMSPLVTLPANVTVQADSGACAFTPVTLGAPVTTDNCGIQSVANNALQSFPVGSTVVTWTVTDIHGNTTTAQQVITVVDDQHPVVKAPADQFYCYNAGNMYTVPALVAADNCGVASVTYTISGATSRSGAGTDASGVFNAGASTITWNVTDVHGNVSTASCAITVNGALTIAIPDVYAINPAVDTKNTIYLGYGPTSLTVTAQATGGTAPYSYLWTTGATTPSISVSASGIYTVTVTDAVGCATTAYIIINTEDVRCGNNNDKVKVCHNGHEMCVVSECVQQHLNHGDRLGACSTKSSSRVSDASGVNEVNLAEEAANYSVTVYPNPVTEVLNIRVSKLEAGATVQLYNPNGVLVLSQRLTKATQAIAFKGLAAGLYYVQVQNGKQNNTRKIVKL